MDNTTCYCRNPQCPLYGRMAPDTQLKLRGWHRQAARFRCQVCPGLVSARTGTAYEAVGSRTGARTASRGKAVVWRSVSRETRMEADEHRRKTLRCTLSDTPSRSRLAAGRERTLQTNVKQGDRKRAPLFWDYFVAQHTKKMRVGQVGMNLTVVNPIQLAENIAMLDHFTNGRVFAGFSRGNTPRWTATFGQHIDVTATESDKSAADQRNRAVFYENWKIVKALWTQDHENCDKALRGALANFANGATSCSQPACILG